MFEVWTNIGSIFALPTPTSVCRYNTAFYGVQHSSTDRHAVRSWDAAQSAADDAGMMSDIGGDRRLHAPHMWLSQRGRDRWRSAKEDFYRVNMKHAAPSDMPSLY